MILSGGLRPSFAMCGLSAAVRLTHREEQRRADEALQTRGQHPAGDGSHTHHTFTQKAGEKLSFLLAGLSEEKAGLAARTVIS